MNTSDLPVAFRALIARPNQARRRKLRHTRKQARWPESALVVDTETSVDPTQRLNFGIYRYCRLRDSGYESVEEGIIYDDDLPTRDPAGFAVLQLHAREHRADVIPGFDDKLRLRSRREFVDKVFWPAAYLARALVVGFNLPFDLSRLAVECGEARGNFLGGFSFLLWEYYDKDSHCYKPHPYRPRLLIKHIDSKRSLLGFGAPANVAKQDRLPKGQLFRGRFLDLRTLTFALTNEAHSLDSACRAFRVQQGKIAAKQHGQIDPQYVEYCRRDVGATHELLNRAKAEFNRHPIQLDPCKCYSPAAVAKSYLVAMGINFPATQFHEVPLWALGAAMNGYYGGRAESRIRREIVPITYLDATSMYPSCNLLLRSWDLVTAERLRIEDCTAEVQAMLDVVTTDDCFNPGFWPSLRFFARIEADNHVLPVRARYGGGDDFTIGVNPFTCGRSVWYAGPDVVAATLRAARAPKVIQAFRLVPVGKQKSLKPIKLYGEIPVDPARQDFFQVAVEARKSLPPASEKDPQWRSAFLKTAANSGSYGVLAQINPVELPQGKSEKVTVRGLDGAFEAETRSPEEPGPFSFPLSAALTTAAARLMLMLLELELVRRGGSYASTDTDALTPIAMEAGGLVPCNGGPHHGYIKALSWSEVESIRARFAALNAYHHSKIPGSIFKLEDENFDGGQLRQLYAYVISAKRGALLNVNSDGSFTIRKHSEHGLGHLLNPTNPDDLSREWIKELWTLIIARALGQQAPEPSWLDRPALSRITVTSPKVLKPLTASERPYADRVKPFNFVLAAHVAPFGHPPGVDPKRVQLITSHNPDSRQWLNIDWTNIYTGEKYAITTSEPVGGRVVKVKSYHEVFEEYQTHPEPKSAGPDGEPCNRQTRGLLERRHVHAASIHYATKESRRLEEVAAGLIHDREQVGLVFADPKDDPWSNVAVPVLNRISLAEIAHGSHISERQIKRLRNGHGVPTSRTRAVLIRFAATYARAQLGPDAPADDIAACKLFVEHHQAASSADPAQFAKATAASPEPKQAPPSAAAGDNQAAPNQAAPGHGHPRGRGGHPRGLIS